MTLHEQIKKHRADTLETSVRELERLADSNEDRAHYLAEEAFKLGLKFALRAIEGSEMLHCKMMKEIKFSNPTEAEREHKNLMNTLASIKQSLINRYAGKP